MADRVDIRIETGHKFARARWDHRYARSQQIYIAESANQRHHTVRGPRSHEKETDGDRRLGNPHLSRLVGRVGLVRAQRVHVHLFRLLAQNLFVVDHMADDLAVKVDNQRHRDHVAAGEDHADKEVVIERISQVVECAGGEVALWKEKLK